MTPEATKQVNAPVPESIKKDLKMWGVELGMSQGEIITQVVKHRRSITPIIKPKKK